MNHYSLWINKHSIRDVETMHEDLFPILKKAHQPVLYSWVDLNSESEGIKSKSIKLVNQVFPELVKDTKPRFVTVWMNNNEYKHARIGSSILHD